MMYICINNIWVKFNCIAMKKLLLLVIALSVSALSNTGSCQTYTITGTLAYHGDTGKI